MNGWMDDRSMWEMMHAAASTYVDDVCSPVINGAFITSDWLLNGNGMAPLWMDGWMDGWN